MLNDSGKKQPEVNLLDNLWSFNYRKGVAPMSGIVKARTAELAFKVAALWCEQNGYRTPAGIKPMIVADETLLTQPAATELYIPTHQVV